MTANIRISALVSALLALSACTLEPRYDAPALPVPDQWPIPATTQPATQSATDSAAPATTSNGAAADIGWRDFFVDARLQQLIALALANNRDLRVAVLNVQVARQQYNVQRSALLPTVQAQGAYDKTRLPAAISGFSSPVTESYYEAEAAMPSFEVDLFGQVRSQSHAALQSYFEQEEARRGAQLSLIAQVADAYLTLASDRELLTLAQQTLKSQQDSFELTKKRHDSGAVSGLDVAQAQTTVESSRVDAARYEGNVAQDINGLTLLVGSQIDAALLPQDFTNDVSGIAALPSGLPSAVLLRRPDVLEAEHALRSANANIGAARAAFFPNISLTSYVGSASGDLSGLFKKGTLAWAFNPTVTVPIFEGGKLRAQLGEARANRDIAVAQYEKAIQSSFRDVANALALTATLANQHEAQQALVSATGQAYDLSQQRYKAGSDSYLDVLEAQRSNYSAEQALISTRLAEQTNRVTLYEALGGGWRERSQ